MVRICGKRVVSATLMGGFPSIVYKPFSMFSPLINVLMQYAGSVLLGIIAGLVCKAYFASHYAKKIREYEGDILKSHAKILELEAKNDKLEKRIRENQRSMGRDYLVMN